MCTSSRWTRSSRNAPSTRTSPSGRPSPWAPAWSRRPASPRSPASWRRSASWTPRSSSWSSRTCTRSTSTCPCRSRRAPAPTSTRSACTPGRPPSYPRRYPMISRSRTFRIAAALSVVAVAASACSSGGKAKTSDDTGGGGNAAGSSGYTIAFITHETPGDTFWDKIKNGAQQAAKDTGVTLKYSNDPDATKQAVLIQNAVDSKVSGIATTLVTPDALAGSVKAATDAKIPVVGLNAGIDDYQKLGALMYFGSDETLAGTTAGKRPADQGA